MFVKCGDLVDARELFDEMHERNNHAGSAMITGYASTWTGVGGSDVFFYYYYQLRWAGIVAASGNPTNTNDMRGI